MRVQAFRVWFNSALQQSVGAARRAGLAISRGIKRAAEKIELSVGVGEDESRFGQSGSRAWMEVLDEARARLLSLFEKSHFERFPRFERFVRRLLGRSAALKKTAPSLPPPRPQGPVVLGVHKPRLSEEAERLQREVRLGVMRAHTGEHAGLRETVEARRRVSSIPGSLEERRKKKDEREGDGGEDGQAGEGS